LAAQCFGGQENVYRWDEVQQKQVQQWCPKPYNAYMLFYQRIENLATQPEAAVASSGILCVIYLLLLVTHPTWYALGTIKNRE
jgi:hypothetical protein